MTAFTVAQVKGAVGVRCSLLIVWSLSLYQIEAKEAAHVFEQFVASFDEPTKSVKAFVRGSTINPATSSGELFPVVKE